MDSEEIRRALTAEIERASVALGGEPEVWGMGSEQSESRERLIGYRDGVEYALGLIGSAPTTPAIAEEIVQPGPELIIHPEPELVDKVERVRDTEV